MTANETNAPVEEVACPSLQLKCPYCNSTLNVEREWDGPAYMQTQEVVGFECSEWACSAEWDRNGELTEKPSWVRFPSVHQNPNPDFYAKHNK